MRRDVLFSLAVSKVKTYKVLAGQKFMEVLLKVLFCVSYM